MPFKARYRFRQYLFGKGYQSYEINVEVLDESDRSFKIKLLQPTCTRRCGDVIWVRKNNVVIPREKPDCTNEWWNNN